MGFRVLRRVLRRGFPEGAYNAPLESMPLRRAPYSCFLAFRPRGTARTEAAGTAGTGTT